jgi:hypothetical protein
MTTRARKLAERRLREAFAARSRAQTHDGSELARARLRAAETELALAEAAATAALEVGVELAHQLLPEAAC